MPFSSKTSELIELQRQIKAMQAKLDDRAERLRQLSSENAELRRTASYSERHTECLIGALVQSSLTALDELPPENLRLHVGTISSAANFLAQGYNSARRVVEVFGIHPKQRFLDWGCGSGRTLNWLLPQGTWRDVWHGCDVDEEAITWLHQQGISSAARCKNFPPLPYPDDYFEGLYSFSVLTHIHPEQHRAWYKELNRILRPGSIALLTTQGDAIVASNRIGDRIAIEQYKVLGWCEVKQSGHYKNASLVSPGFTLESLKGYFDVLEYKVGGYQELMDQLLVRKRASGAIVKH
jgi:SAM-dependent methyltransferase